ncbi:MAG: ABC transporter ATP-binding protein [Flavobacteriaceae bacterium]
MFKEEKNSAIFLRPRFSLDVDENEETILKNIKDTFLNAKKKYKTKIVDGHIFIDVPDKAAHFWSPQLHLEVVEKSEHSCVVKGLFGPKPQVWTLFMFLHFIIGTAFLIFAIMLYVRYSLHERFAFPLIMVIALPIVWVLMYFLGRIGRDTGQKQMKEMQVLLKQSLP